MSPTTNDCPELETLFVAVAEGDQAVLEHAFACPDCSAILEEHRQLEKDLFRVVDPLPPPNFTRAVMAKVASAPAPVSSELKVGLGVLLASVGSFLALFISNGSWADVGASVARGVVGGRTLLVAASNGLEALWGTAAIPFVGICFVLLLTSLFGLRRLVSAPQSA